MAHRTDEQIKELKDFYENSNNWEEIQKEEFYNTFGNTDIICRIENEYLYPYVTIWQTRGGKLIAKSVPQNLRNLKNKFYLPK